MSDLADLGVESREIETVDAQFVGARVGCSLRSAIDSKSAQLDPQTT